VGVGATVTIQVLITSCCPSLSGDEVPKGRDAIGWRIAVYWKDDRTFYEGQVYDYEASTGRHKVTRMGLERKRLAAWLVGDIFGALMAVDSVGPHCCSPRLYCCCACFVRQSPGCEDAH
jgi:hypothetical protein